MMKNLAMTMLGLAGFAAAENVLTLTSDNFQDTISNNEHVLVEFFAPWCGHCKNLAPEYEKAATALKEEESAVILGAVDATQESDLAQQFGVRGYPTLKWFVDGEAGEYTGGRDEATILSWIRKKTGPPATLLDGTDAINAFSGKSKVALVAFVESAEAAEYNEYVAYAKTDDELPFGYSTSAEAAAEFGATIPSVVLFKKFDEGKAVMTEDITKSAVANFINANKNPIVIDFDMSVVQDVFNSAIGKVAYLFAEADDALQAGFKEIATEKRGDLVFVTGGKEHTRVNDYVGVDASDFPRLVILDTAGQGNLKKYPLLEGSDKAALEAHVNSFLAGELKPHFKSEKEPESNDGDVFIVTGNNFAENVLAEDKDVLLEIYAPWCGHCKKLAPAWEELGAHFNGDDNVVVAKMDGTLNEVENLDASGFPTLKFFPAQAGLTAATGLDYNGGRTFEDLKTYIDNNRKTTAAATEETTEEEEHDEL